jgi:signal transduction histidine kinase
VRISSSRLLLAGLSLALALAAGGALWDIGRFGTSPEAAGARVETYMRAVLSARSREVTSLTNRATSLTPDVANAIVDREALPQVFLKLVDITAPSHGTASLTIYSADYRTLAWSDGPAEDLPAERLRGPDGLFVTEGTLGLRLVHIQSLRQGDHQVGVAAAETLLSFAVGGAPERHLAFPTPYGDVSLVLPSLSSAGDNVRRPHTFMVTDATGAPLVEVRYDPATIAATRSAFRRDRAAIAALPIILSLLLLAGPWLDRRRRSARRGEFLGWTAAVAALLIASTAAVLQLSRVAQVADLARIPAWGLLAVGLCALGPVSLWLQRRPRRDSAAQPARFAAEQLATGIVAAIFLIALQVFFHWRLNAAGFDQWQFPLFPLRLPSLLGLAGVLLVTAAGVWGAASALAIGAERWRVRLTTSPPSAVAVLLWSLAFAASAAAAVAAGFPIAVGGLVVSAVTVMTFGLLATRVRRGYRRATQAARLTLLFAMLVAPALASYATEDFYADRTARHVIEAEYSQAVQRAEQPQHLQEELGAAQTEIDAFPGLADIVNEVPQTPTQAAFAVWSGTRLARNRVTSAIELYDASGALVSRFALNVPEYGPGGIGDRVTSCTWIQSGEAGRFGAEERRMLRGERALCDPAGGPPRGSIVVHIMPDYHALPFVSSDDPYFDVLRPGDTEHTSRIADLQVAVYGWGPLTRFASGNVAWPITPGLFDRIYQSRQSFWTDLTAEGRNYHVYFSNDRGGIYAVGYPVTSPFEHLTRLAEAVALLFGVFILLLLGATAFGPFVRRKAAPLKVLVNEVRTSFYRKLFLYFVLAAVGPVVALALIFSTYMSDKFRADIEGEATDVVIVARRVFEELLTLQQTGGPSAPSAPTDDLLVWIGQAINQDVNLFSGSQLVATSQRDLFDSGLLPTRTPAAIYRSIALNRLPSYTGDDRLGGFSYLIAAAPVPGRGRDTILSVPLALRQRELAHELDELNRGLLVGAVLVVLLVAMLGVYVAGRVSTPVARLTRATRQIAAGRLDVRIAADTADELRRLVDDFNTMAATLAAQRDELARTNQLKAWAEMARQVAHEIKNPLTPIQLSAEHLQRVHADRGRPLGDVFDLCLDTILRQVRLLRQIASEFSNFAASPTPHVTAVQLDEFLLDLAQPYQVAGGPIETIVTLAPNLFPVAADRTLLSRAMTNLLENARQAMPSGGTISIVAEPESATRMRVIIHDSGVGMDATERARAFEPYFSTKTAGSGLGLPNAKRNVELCGGTMTLESVPGQGTSITITLQRAAEVPAGLERG